MIMKKRLITLLMVLMVYPLMSQTTRNGSDFNFNADAVSRYIWRGINLGGPSPHIQPSIEYSVAGLAIGVWSSYGLGAGSEITEVDLYISYSPSDYFTFTVTDYFFPSDTPFSRGNYFNLSKGKTGHTIEGMAGFNGTPGFPVWVIFAMNLYGVDGTDENGKNYNAKYLELGYSATFREIEIGTFAGMALDNPNTAGGATGWYGDSRGIINLGISLSKSIRFTDTVSLPVFSSLVFNPEAGNIFLVGGLNF
jgi:hypothetical protein